ncbi:MAG TPA: DUF2157 domain-containing protein [Euzebyales bacterium]
MAGRLDTSERRLAGTLREAVAQKIITEQQARQIADIRAGTPEAPTVRAAGWVRPLVAEALGYVGGALALLSSVILIEQYWAELPPWGRVTLLAATAVGLLTAGALVRVRDGPLDRLRGFLWLLSAVAVGGTVAIGLTEYTALQDSELMLATGVAVAVYGVVLWLARTASLQQLVVFAAVLTAVTAGIGAAEPSWVEATGLAVWMVGMVWAWAAWVGWIRPRRTGLLIGAAAAALGPITVPDDRYGWILAIGLATAGLLVAVSIPAHETVLLGLGVVGIVAYVPRIVFQYFGDTLGAPVSLLITGVVLVAVALTIARAQHRPQPEHRQ